MLILSGLAHILVILRSLFSSSPQHRRTRRLVSLVTVERVRYLALIISFAFTSLYCTENDLSFAKEFIQTYDLSKRDTHEYNPYILKKTGNSFLQLEKNLKDEGFTLSGRL